MADSDEGVLNKDGGNAEGDVGLSAVQGTVQTGPGVPEQAEHASALEEEKPFDMREFRRKMLAAAFGSVMEWYDFALFGGLADVLGDVFFPDDAGSDAKLLESLAVFGAAFVMRPIGGLLIGYSGDKVGRKKALQISIVVMMIPSFLIGCLPTYDQAGFGGTALLCLLRLIQGLAVGGELVAAYVFCIESAPEGTKLFWGAIALDSAVLGTLIGTGVSALFKGTMSDSFLHDWGWRIGFFLNNILGVSGMMLRAKVGDPEQDMEEDKEFSAADRNNDGELSRGEWIAKYGCDKGFDAYDKNNDGVIDKEEFTFTSHAQYTLKHHRYDILMVTGICSTYPVAFYQSFVWMPYLYSDEIVENEIENYLVINTSMFTLMMLMFIPISWFASRWNADDAAVALLRVGNVGLLVVALPAYLLINTRHPWAAALAQLMLGVFTACYGAAMPYFIVYSFPSRVRVFGVGLAYNLSQALFGGPTPVLSTVLAKDWHPVAPAIWLMLVAVISLISLQFHQQVKRHQKAGDQTESAVQITSCSVPNLPPDPC